jgi:hypothetical protein
MDGEKAILSPEIWAEIEKRWPGVTAPDKKKPTRPRHTCPSMVGEMTFGPWCWRMNRSIPWAWIIKADQIGPACRHLRVGLLCQIFYSAFRCDYHRPARLSIEDSSHVRVDENIFHQSLRELKTAGLIEMWMKPGQKSRVVPLHTFTRHEIGRWKTYRSIWWPPISQICGTMPATSVLAYLFLTMHLTRGSNRVVVDRILPGWVRGRRDFERGVKPLIESGLVCRDGKIGHYTLPVLSGPAPDVEVKPSWTGATPPASQLPPPPPSPWSQKNGQTT